MAHPNNTSKTCLDRLSEILHVKYPRGNGDHPIRPKTKKLLQNGNKQIVIHASERHRIRNILFNSGLLQDTGRPNLERRKRPQNVTGSSKQKSTAKYNAERLDRLRDHNVYIRSSRAVTINTKDLGHKLLEEERIPVRFSGYPREKVDHVLDRVQSFNKNRLQRDITL